MMKLRVLIIEASLADGTSERPNKCDVELSRVLRLLGAPQHVEDLQIHTSLLL